MQRLGMPMSLARRTVIRLRDFSMPKRKVEGPAAEPASRLALGQLLSLLADVDIKGDGRQVDVTGR